MRLSCSTIWQSEKASRDIAEATMRHVGAMRTLRQKPPFSWFHLRLSD